MKKTQKRTVIRNKPIPESFKGKVYLDPTYDPAFKELFNSEDALKDFLNGVLELEGNEKIRELHFRFEKPVEFRVPQRKKVIFDIFATTGSGRFLNIEMQRLEHDYFIDRTILYKAFLIIKGRKEMERKANTGMNGLSIAGSQYGKGGLYRFQRKISIFSLAFPTLRRLPTK